MSADVVSEVTGVNSVVTLGERLRSARKQKDMDISKVAEQLHLNVETVDALEHGDESRLPARVFVRGYIRNYARLMGMSESKVLAEYDQQFTGSIEQEVGLTPVSRVKKEEVSRPGKGFMAAFKWLFLLLLITAFVAWFVYNNQKPTGDSGLALVDQMGEVVEKTLDTHMPGELALPLRAEASIEATQAEIAPPVAKEVTEEVSVAAVDVPPEATPGEAVEVTEAEVEAGVESIQATPGDVVETASIQPDTISSEAPVDTPDEEVAETAVEEGVFIKFTAPCWVDIRDSQRKFKLFGEMKKGEERKLGGVPPYKVIIGNAAAVQIRVNGEAYDISRHASGNVARFTLNTN